MSNLNSNVLNKKFQEAGIHHKRGDLVKAQSLYRSILRIYPKHFEALYYLGVTYIQTGEPKTAVDLIEKALRINPNSPYVLNDLGYAYKLLKMRDHAIRCYERAIQLKKDFAEAYNNRAIIYSELEKWTDALLDFDKAISLKPNYPEAYTNRGAALKSLGRFEEALISHDRAIALSPFFSEAYNNRGLVQKGIGELDKAISNFFKAIECRPNYSNAYYNLGIVYMDQEKYDKALTTFDRAIALKPDYIEAHNSRGRVLQELDRHEDALKAFDRAIELNPNYPDALNNRGNVLQYFNRLEEALESYEKAIKISPYHYDSYCNRANTLKDLNRLDDAIKSVNKSIELKNDYAEGYWSRANLYLLQGNLKNGLADYEWRKKSHLSAKSPIFDAPQWEDGLELDGKILFIYPELYLGDAIQFSRYALLAEQRGARVIMAVNESMHALLRTMSSSIQFLPKGSMPDHFDYCCSLMSLPFAFNTTIETIPTLIPYLKADASRVEKWKNKIGKHGYRIGICWQGSTRGYSTVLRRSFPLSIFEKISQIPDVRLISLQKSDGIDQLLNLPHGMRVETLGDDFDAAPDAFLDSAAVIENLDLIITSDTAIAHLSGALGCLTWVALKDVPDWRWLLDRSDCPWYPTMKLFRQTRRDDWSTAFDQIESELKGLLNAK